MSIDVYSHIPFSDSDPTLIGHCSEYQTTAGETEVTKTFGGLEQVIPVSNSKLILSEWARADPVPMSLQPPRSSDNQEERRIIYCLVSMLGGAVHLDSREWAESKPQAIQTQIFKDPWMLQIKIPGEW